MTSSWLLPRIVELTGTYLVHSTAFLAGVWGLLFVQTLLNRWKSTLPIEQRGEALFDVGRFCMPLLRSRRRSSVSDLITHFKRALLSRRRASSGTQTIWNTDFPDEKCVTALPKGPQPLRLESNPYLAERAWKTAAVLALITAPLSVFSGRSHSTWEWSLRSQSPSMIESVTYDSADHAVNVTHELNLKMAQKPRTASSDELALIVPRSPPADPQIEFDSTPSLTRVPSAFTVGTDKIANQRPADFDGNERTTISSLSFESTVNERSQSESTSHHTVRFEPIRIWINGIGAAILAWFGWTLFRLAMRTFALHRLLARCEPVDGQLRQELHRLTPDRRRIRLLCSRSVAPNLIWTRRLNLVTEPFACGIFRWTIVLPDWIERELSPAEQKALLAHEFAHLVRRDPFWLLIGEILCTCLAFQPLNFVARSRWQRATELMCDDWAVERHVSPTSLANCLTRIAELRLAGRTTALGLMAVGESGSLTHRIQWLLRSERAVEPKRHRGRLLTTMLALAAGLMAGANGPHVSLILSAEADDDSQEATTLDGIQRDMTEILNQLARVESQLSGDVEATALARSLRIRAAALKNQMSR